LQYHMPFSLTGSQKMYHDLNLDHYKNKFLQTDILILLNCDK